MNEFADLSNDEFRRLYGGLKREAINWDEFNGRVVVLSEEHNKYDVLDDVLSEEE